MPNKAAFEDCIDCPFCLVSAKGKKYATVFCYSLNRVVAKVLIADVLANKAKAGLPKDCPCIKKENGKN